MEYIKLLILITCAIFISSYFMYVTKPNQSKKQGIVIILNGPSASGKSTLQKELQKLFPIPYLGIGLDTFFVGVLPERFVIGPQLENDIDPKMVMKGIPSIDQEGNKLFTLLVGPIGDQVMQGMHHAIAAYAQQGNNCIVDYIAYKKEWIPDLCKALNGITVYLVGVDCSLEILEQREKARGRAIVEGHARSHYLTVHEHMNNMYDLRVNTGTMDPATCAKIIHDFIITNPNPKNFNKIC